LTPDKTLQAVFIDMDGTLVETESSWWETEIAVMREYGYEWTLEDQELALGGPMHRVIDYMSEKTGASSAEIDNKLISAMQHRLSTRPPKLQPGWKELIPQLIAADIKLALVSASPRILVDTVIAGVELDFFDLTIAAEDPPETKPFPDPFWMAADLLNIPRTNCLVIEDSNTGVTSATRAGMPTIAVPAEIPIVTNAKVVVINSISEINYSDIVNIFNDFYQVTLDA
jgi:HAD superfamily hydrolase (TIGR01509 family)